MDVMAAVVITCSLTAGRSFFWLQTISRGSVCVVV
jgi:hypothetical protein